MDNKMTKLMFSLIRSAICDNLLSCEEKSLFDLEILSQIVKIAKQHDILHLIACGLKKNGLFDENSKEFEIEIFRAVYRYEQLEYELRRICESLEKVKIQFVPLKGSVIRKYYVEPWMRTSCDIDVLVRPKDLDSAIKCFVENLGYRCECRNFHDVSMFSENGIHIELHYILIEDGRLNFASEVLQTVWDRVSLHNEYSYWFEMSDEMFYFYHIAHMANHFENGGCGIRPFIDLWVLDNLDNVDKEKRDALLASGNLLRFAEISRKLSRIWFDNAEYDSITKKTEDYIFRGGVYGNNENRITVQQQKRGGKLRYILSRVFVPYQTLKFKYPILVKQRWLTPIFEVIRWFNIIFCGRLKSSVREIQINNSISKKEQADAARFLDDIGL